MEQKNYKLLSRKDRLKRQAEISKVFIKLGFIAFGGPAAHISMMDDEIVEKRRWISRERFVDFIGVSNLIPGPNSTEMVIYLGLQRGGLLGLINAGTSFILPAMLLTLVFAYLYREYGSIPQITSILAGIKPVTIAIVINALFRLSKAIIKDRMTIFFAIIIGVIYLLGVAEIPLLFVSGLIMMIIKNRNRMKNRFHSISAPSIFFVFLKIGSVFYGSGYVLLAFLEAELVNGLGVLTRSEIIDAVAIGQFIPGPLFTTATFVGYLLKSTSGAIFATIGIFLPAFIIVLILNPIIEKIRESDFIAGLLDGINIASLVLMLAVSIKLASDSIINIETLSIFLTASYLILKFKINSAWIIILGGLAGWIIG